MTIQTILEQCDEIGRLDEKATPGPWLYYPRNESGSLVTYSNAPQMVWGSNGPGYGTICETCSSGLRPRPDGKQSRDAEFIATARTFAPAHAKMLKVAIEALQKECAKFQFPDEDIPICFEALQQITESFHE